MKGFFTMNIKKFVTLFIILFSIIFVIIPSYASETEPTPSAIASINIEELDLSRIDQTKIDDLKSSIEDLRLNHSDSGLNTGSYPNRINEDDKTINVNEVIEIYKELSGIISNKDMIYFIEDNKVQLTNAGFGENLLDMSISLFKTFDANTIIDIAQNDLNINKILASYETGDSIDSIFIYIIDNTPPSTTLKITFKLLFANSFFRLFFAFLIVIGIYSVFITGLIFKKANKKVYRYTDTSL